MNEWQNKQESDASKTNLLLSTNCRVIKNKLEKLPTLCTSLNWDTIHAQWDTNHIYKVQ